MANNTPEFHLKERVRITDTTADECIGKIGIITYVGYEDGWYTGVYHVQLDEECDHHVFFDYEMEISDD